MVPLAVPLVKPEVSLEPAKIIFAGLKDKGLVMPRTPLDIPSYHLDRTSHAWYALSMRRVAARAEDVTFWLQLCDTTPYLCAEHTFFLS